jgi:hypothetical protein
MFGTCTPNTCPQPEPRLTLELTSTACHHVGDEIVVEVWMHEVFPHIAGGQFFLQYDATKLQLQGGAGAITPGDPPMSVQVYECSTAQQTNPQCTPTDGLIDYAVGVETLRGPDSVISYVVGDHRLAVIRFTAHGEVCDVAGLLSFRDADPPTRLTDVDGGAVTPPLVNLPALTIDDTGPTISGCPDDITPGTDPDACSAVVTWTPPTASDCTGATITQTGGPTPGSNFPLGTTPIQYTATDGCGNVSYCNFTVTVVDNQAPVAHCPGDITVFPDPGGCTKVVTWDSYASDNCPGATIACDPPSGSTFSGITLVTCTATDAAGNQSTCTFTVTVQDYNDLVVTVDLCPTVASSVTRCITFDLWTCSGNHATEELELPFADGQATVVFQSPCASAWECVTARDRLHTLRRKASSVPVGDHYEVSFASPTKCLIGGNLNDDAWVDILDFGVLMSRWNHNYGTGDTACNTPSPHADIDGDGFVNLADFTFIQINFLQGNEANCCELPGFREAGPLTRISVAELHARGLDALASGDLNGDGWLDEADIVAFMNGARPHAATQADDGAASPVEHPAHGVE